MTNITKTAMLVVLGMLLSNIGLAAGIGNSIVVRLVGTGEAYDGNPLFETFGLEPLDANCFDLDVVDAKTGRVIGQATDCLSDISSSITDNGIMLTGTTFFYLPGGTVITRGLTTVQPTLHGSRDFTHITGAIPSPEDNNVIYGDRKFRNAYGPVRLSGAVNMSRLDADGLLTFDCVFVLDI